MLQYNWGQNILPSSAVYFNRYREFSHEVTAPFWGSKTMKWPLWCTKPTLWKSNSFLMLMLSFVPIIMLAKWVKTFYFATELTSVRKLTEWHSPLKFLLRGYTPLNYILSVCLNFLACMFCFPNSDHGICFLSFHKLCIHMQVDASV